MNNQLVRVEQPAANNEAAGENDVLVEKKQLEEQISQFEAKLNQMIFDLSNDHPDLVTKVNQQASAPVKKHLTDAEAKEIWRVIANRCHPDKNTKRDPKLHEIFLKAKKCKEEGDLAELYFCYVELLEYTEANSLVLKLLRNSDVIRESLETLRKRYGMMKEGFFGKLFELYQVNRFQASVQYRNYLIMKSKGQI